MKKILSLLLVLLMVFGFAACTIDQETVDLAADVALALLEETQTEPETEVETEIEAEPETDRIESLDEEDVEVVYSFERRRGKAPGDHKIRKAYRKFIRKHREDTPEVFETPHEIEVAAGVVHTAEAKQLHEAYERVRYSPACDV